MHLAAVLIFLSSQSLDKFNSSTTFNTSNSVCINFFFDFPFTFSSLVAAKDAAIKSDIFDVDLMPAIVVPVEPFVRNICVCFMLKLALPEASYKNEKKNYVFYFFYTCFNLQVFLNFALMFEQIYHLRHKLHEDCTLVLCK